jgi:hypothetical protein
MSKPEQGYPLWRKTIPVHVDVETLRRAEQRIELCEACAPDLAETPFDFVIDAITGSDPEVTDYVLPEAAHCPRCSSPVRTGYWRWYSTDQDGRKVFVLPGTLVVLKKDGDEG